MAAAMATPSITYLRNMGTNESARLARMKPIPTAAAPMSITMRASTRSRSQPTGNTRMPQVSAATLGNRDTVARLHPNSFSSTGTNTGTVAYPDPTIASMVTNRLATISQPCLSCRVIRVTRRLCAQQPFWAPRAVPHDRPILPGLEVSTIAARDRSITSRSNSVASCAAHFDRPAKLPGARPVLYPSAWVPSTWHATLRPKSRGA